MDIKCYCISSSISSQPLDVMLQNKLYLVVIITSFYLDAPFHT